MGVGGERVPPSIPLGALCDQLRQGVAEGVGWSVVHTLCGLASAGGHRGWGYLPVFFKPSWGLLGASRLSLVEQLTTVAGTVTKTSTTGKNTITNIYIRLESRGKLMTRESYGEYIYGV